MNRTRTVSPCADEHRHHGREAVPVDREAAERVVRDPDVLPVELVVRGLRLGLDDERAQQAASDLVGRVVVRVVHQGPGPAGHEVVGVLLARRERLLGDERHAVLEEVLELDAVEVDARRLLEVVLEDDPELVALGGADRRPRPLGVEPQRRDGRQLLVDGPLHLVDGQAEDLDVPVHLRRQRRDGVRDQQVRDLREGRLQLELGVVVGGAQDVGQLGEHLGRVDLREGGREVADVAADDVAGGDVVLGPAGRDARGGRGGGGRGRAGEAPRWRAPRSREPCSGRRSPRRVWPGRRSSTRERRRWCRPRRWRRRRSGRRHRRRAGSRGG